MIDSVPIVTIISNNYLAHARTLAQSYKACYPNGQVFVCLVDKNEGYFDPKIEPFILISADELGIPNWSAFSFRYDILELNTAVKPFLLEYLMQTYQLDRIAYFDPDIVLYAPLDELNQLLDNATIILTPHILDPIDDEQIPWELTYLQVGTYNLGFIAISAGSETARFLKWWQERLTKYCTYEPTKGLFVDQHWMDLAPALFSSVIIWRNPACNIAYWNIMHRPIERHEKSYFVRGNRVLFIHYSGFMIDRVEEVSKYQKRFVLADLTAAHQELMLDYKNRLIQNGYHDVIKTPYSYRAFDNGVDIPYVARKMYRELDPIGTQWPNPFFTGRGSFFEYVNSPHGKQKPLQRTYITRLAAFTYQADPRIQNELLNALEREPYSLMQWFHVVGRYRFNLDESFLTPMRPKLLWEKLRAFVAIQRNVSGLALRVRLSRFLHTYLSIKNYQRVRNYFDFRQGRLK